MKVYYVTYTFIAKGRTDVAFAEELTTLHPLIWLENVRKEFSEDGTYTLLTWKDIDVADEILSKLTLIEMDENILDYIDTLKENVTVIPKRNKK